MRKSIKLMKFKNLFQKSFLYFHLNNECKGNINIIKNELEFIINKNTIINANVVKINEMFKKMNVINLKFNKNNITGLNLMNNQIINELIQDI